MPRQLAQLAFCLAVLLAALAVSAAPAAPVRIGAEARLPDNERSHYSRFVNWRPADRETVQLNPPRLSWPYWPDWPKDWSEASHAFRLQISSRPDFSAPAFQADCLFNFYNAIPELKGTKTWFWRVGYDVGAPKEKWSATRSFTIADGAAAWDRAVLAKPPLASIGHPRVLFNASNLAAIRGLAETNPESAAALKEMRAETDRIIKSDVWRNFPKTDRDAKPQSPFHSIAHDLALVCFVWKMTGDTAYAGVRERALTLASYPSGGRSSPEGLGGDGSEDATQVNEFLALLFDWLYPGLNDAERKIMIDSLEWRTDHIMNRFAWRRGRSGGGTMIRLTYYQGTRQLNDERFALPESADWASFSKTAKVPPGATRANIELFNYYAAGTVWFEGLALSPQPGAPSLLVNGDFADADGAAPRGWHSNDFGKKSSFKYDPRGGEAGKGAVAIVCPSSGDRGSWSQPLELKGPAALHLQGRYRTPGLVSVMPVGASSLSGQAASHQFEASMDTAVCGLVLYEHSAVGREWYDVIVNYMAGVTCGHGFDESWNEGPGYGTSKFKWLTDATLYFDTAIPGANFGKNPFYPRIGEFFSRVIPVGMPHNAWGNQNDASRGNHLATFRKMAYLTGEGRFLLNWQQYGGERKPAIFRPWIDYVLPHYYKKPEPRPESDPVGLFPIDGWGMAATGPPSLASTYAEGAGLIFQSRPRGGFSHSFNSDNSFILHAYGQMLNHGGGSSGNGDAYAYHAMSHNTVLVDGIGQAQPSEGQAVPEYARMAGFARGDGSGGAPPFVYFCGDASHAYPAWPAGYKRWSLPIAPLYDKGPLTYMQRFIRHVLFVRGRYFVIFDDLAASKPATWTWLYHILPGSPLNADPARMAFDYKVGGVSVRLQQIARPAALKFVDRRGEDALVNPITGEDYRKLRKDDILCGHNLWIANSEKAPEWQFLAVVYPAQAGMEIPAIERIDDATVRVGGDVICFNPQSPAAPESAILVDPSALR